MLQLSELSKRLPASPIRKLVPYADGAKSRGIKVYHLNIGQPDLPSPKEALDAVKNNDLSIVSYAHSAGNLSYRQGLSKYYQGIGIDLTPDDIIVTNGGSEAIVLAFQVTCNPGDEVLVMEPFYTNYNSFAIQQDLKFVPITTSIETGFATPDVEEFEKKITPKTKAIMLNNPGNPTGTLYPKEAVEKICHIAKKHNLFVITDEVYREYCYTEDPHYSCMQVEDCKDNVILIDSVSKRYSLCGVRVGCIASRNKEIMASVMRFAQARLCAPMYGQIAAEGALSTPKEYFDAVKAEYIARRDCMLDLLNKMDGVYSPMPMGAFYTIASLPVDDAEKFAIWMLQDFNYNGQTVMMTPAAGFYATPGMGKNQVRLAYVLCVEDIKNAMKCIDEALKVYPGRTK